MRRGSPGATTKSALWTRGAAGDQTRVTFDGVPLFDPMHAIGAVSVFNGDAIGSTIFHSSVQPITADGGLAGLVDVTSRHGARDQPAVLGGLSMLAGRLATGGALESGRVAWTFGLRRSYVDLCRAAWRTRQDTLISICHTRTAT